MFAVDLFVDVDSLVTFPVVGLNSILKLSLSLSILF